MNQGTTRDHREVQTASGTRSRAMQHVRGTRSSVRLRQAIASGTACVGARAAMLSASQQQERQAEDPEENQLRGLSAADPR
jgi:hypothetical protein